MAGNPPNGRRVRLLQQAGLDPADFPAVQVMSDLLPWEHPQHVGPGPMRLPPRNARLRFPENTFVGDPSLPQVGLPSGELPPPLLTPPPSLDEQLWIIDPHHYASVRSGSFAPGVAGAANTLVAFLLQPPGKRNWLTLRNGSAVGGPNIYVDFGKAAAVNTAPLILVPGQTVLLDSVVPQDDCYALADAAAAVFVYSYSNIANGVNP